MKVSFRVVPALTALTMAVFATPVPAQEQLTVWWAKGSFKAEDDALAAAVRKYETKTGVKVDLQQIPADEIVEKTLAALKNGTAPDVAYADAFDFQTTGQWAYEGRLEDLSDVINPIKDRFLKNTIETTYLYNDKAKKKSYYAFPIKQQTMQIQYWKDLLHDAGRKEADIPTTWKPYWEFWCKVPASLATKTKKHPYGIGQPMGPNSSDSYYAFLTFADAYNVKMVDDNGKLLVDDPKVKQGLVSALRDYTAAFKQHCVPNSARVWRDEDNDAAFRNKLVVMTPNTNMALLAAEFEDANNAALPEEHRAKAKQYYNEMIVTAGYPKKPDGSKMVYRVSVKTGVVFESGKNKKNAKDFVRGFLQDENLQPYVEAGLGRWFPVMKTESGSKFWQADAHRKVVVSQFGAGTVAFEFTKNYKFTLLNKENVWAKAMGRVINYDWPPEKAVDEMIDRIKAVAG